MDAMDVGITRRGNISRLSARFFSEHRYLPWDISVRTQIEADGDESLARFRELARGDVEES